MTSTNPLLSSWKDEKEKPSLEDGDAEIQLKKPRNKFNFRFVIAVLIGLGIIRMIQVKIGYMMSNKEIMIDPVTSKPVEYITDFKDVRLNLVPSLGHLSIAFNLS
jgi:hypothetical protein